MVLVDAAWALTLALGGLATLVLSVAALARWPALALYIAGAFVLVAWEIPNPPPLASVSGTNIYFLDVFSLALIVIAAADARATQPTRRLRFITIATAIVLGIALIRGLVSEDLGQAINEFRSFFYPIAMLLWALTRDWERLAPTMRRLAFLLGWGLTGVAAIHIAQYGLSGATDLVVDESGNIGQTLRPLVSGQALVLLLCMFVVLGTIQRRVLWTAVSVPLFASVIIIVQQRTVWVAAAAAVVAVVLFSTWRAKMRLSIALAGLVGLALFAFATGSLGSIAPSLQESSSDLGTYDGRLNSWWALIDQARAAGLESILFGQPFGVGYGRLEGLGRWVEYAPHNWYLTTFLRSGLVGLALLVLFCGLAIYTAARAARRGVSAPLAIFAAVIVYGWSYSWPWYICLFLGWAAATALSALEVEGFTLRQMRTHERRHDTLGRARATGRSA